MKNIGFIGLGNMGMGMAKNLSSKGFAVKGFDIRKEVRDSIAQFGAEPVDSAAQTAVGSDVIFIMVLNGPQIIDVLEGGLKEKLGKGQTVILCPTAGGSYVKQAEALLVPLGVEVLDSPVSGGKGGAESGTLTLMLSGKKSVLEDNREILEAIAKNIYHVGEEVGQGQAVKACMQILVGVSYEGLFEAMVLGAKAGVDMEILCDVLNNSVVGSNLSKGATDLILDRKFKDTGAHIGVTYKDLGISMSMAKELGVPMPAGGLALEMFRAGLTNYPDSDNWALIKVLEALAKTEVKRKKK